MNGSGRTVLLRGVSGDCYRPDAMLARLLGACAALSIVLIVSIVSLGALERSEGEGSRGAQQVRVSDGNTCVTLVECCGDDARGQLGRAEADAGVVDQFGSLLAPVSREGFAIHDPVGDSRGERIVDPLLDRRRGLWARADADARNRHVHRRGERIERFTRTDRRGRVNLLDERDGVGE